MSPEITLLERTLIERIEREGPVTFRDFMQAALYDPEHGYYNTERLKIGPEGDYYTASNVHGTFGAILAKSFVDLFAELNQQDLAAGESAATRVPLTLVEMGAGTGQLACDIITAIRDEHPAFFEGLKYIIAETSPAMRSLQHEKLSTLWNCVRWADLGEMEPQTQPAIFFSNEMVDAMPVHCVRFDGARIEERWVTLMEGKRLTTIWREPSTARLAEYVGRIGAGLAEGHVFEIGLDAVEWLGLVARVVDHGFLVTIDYGDQAAHLWADRRAGTLRSFYKHRLTDSVLERPGHQDITGSVNFSALIEYGRDFGFELVSYERQAAFLMRMGLLERISRLKNADDLKERLAIKNLFVPGGVSDNFRVLIQRRG